MSKQREWLLGQIDRWTSEQLITAEQRSNLRALYPEEKESSWGLILFCSFGAAVIGLGIILLIAHNWHQIPRLAKVALMVGSTALAHGIALELKRRRGWQERVGEAVFLLGTMLFGASIWLIAQAYNIDEHYPNGFLLWSFGALALAWAVSSIPQVIAAIVLITIWGVSEVEGFREPQGWALILLIVGVAPLIWLKRSAVALAVLLAGLTIMLMTNASFFGGPATAFTTVFSFAAFLVAVARLLNNAQEFPAGAAVTSFFGYAGFFLCTYLLSFSSLANDLLRWGDERSDLALYIYAWGFFALALVAWLGVAAAGFSNRERRAAVETWLCPIALIYTQVLALKGFYTEGAFITGVFNVIFVAFAVIWMVRGCQTGELKKTVLGSLLFSAWVFARYFDLFDSLALRGVAFLLLGSSLFAEGFFYRRLRRESAKGTL